MNRFYFVFPLLLMGCGGKSAKTDQTTADTEPAPYAFPYALNAPADVVTLPKRLREVSGLTYYKANKLLCIQDEEAAVFVYDIVKKRIIQEAGFGGYGDFEGIEYVNGDVYALESNGNLYRFTLDLSSPKSVQVAQTPTDLPAGTEAEGLGYDPKTERLLIAVKKGGGPSSSRAVYSFGLRQPGRIPGDATHPKTPSKTRAWTPARINRRPWPCTPKRATGTCCRRPAIN